MANVLMIPGNRGAFMASRVFLYSRSCFVIFLVCLISGCVSPGTSEYQYREPGGTGKLPNEAVVALPFSDTWDLLIGHLAKSFFVINNVEKASRIINVSFTTDRPEDYVDCGNSERSFEFNGESQNYKYRTAGSSSFKTAGKWGPYSNLPWVAYMNRKTSLEGRMNIYVAPKENDTIVTVNTRYVFTNHVSGQQQVMNGYGNVVQVNPVPDRTDTLSFNTGQTGSSDWGTPQEPFIVKCHSTGKLESDILALTKR
jgi:hypothetical protein